MNGMSVFEQTISIDTCSEEEYKEYFSPKPPTYSSYKFDGISYILRRITSTRKDGSKMYRIAWNNKILFVSARLNRILERIQINPKEKINLILDYIETNKVNDDMLDYLDCHLIVLEEQVEGNSIGKYAKARIDKAKAEGRYNQKENNYV